MRPLQRITHIAILTALSLILFVLEGFLPLPLPVPGAKLGLAAVATLVALYRLPYIRDAGTVLALRILLAPHEATGRDGAARAGLRSSGCAPDPDQPVRALSTLLVDGLITTDDDGVSYRLP